MTPRWTILLFCAVLANAAEAAPGDKTNLVRDLAGRVGPVIGSALTCPDIARPRIQLIVDKFTAVIAEAATSETERSGLTQLLDRNVADGRGAVTSGRIDCRQADRQLADLERSIVRPGPGPSTAVAPPFTATAATTPTAPVPAAAPVRGVTDRDIRFGITAAFTGPVKERGRQMKLGIDTAFQPGQRRRRRGRPDAQASCRRRRQ